MSTPASTPPEASATETSPAPNAPPTDARNASGAGSTGEPAGAAAGTRATQPAPSALAPLRAPVFRMLWFAWLAANVTMWMNEVAAAWLMTSLTDSKLMVALVQSASTLPVFVLGLPSGALADIVDRRRYFAFTQLWVAAVAIVLCALAWAGALTAPLLLALTFANGIGMAMRWPVFAAIVPEVVPRRDLPQALALNGVAMNMSRIVGPVVAGALLASAGSAFVFALNAAMSMLAFVLILRWRTQRKASTLPGERFIGAMRVGLQHVRQSAHMRNVLVRIFVFFLQSAGLNALLPLVARDTHGGGAGTYTLLLAAGGAGAIVAALSISRFRGRADRDSFVRWGTLVHAAMALLVALAPTLWIAVPAMAVAGMAWIVTANTLTVAAQMALPDWVRARGMSIYQMALMGGIAAGAALWGQVAGMTSVPTALLCAAAFGPLALLATRRISVAGGDDEDLSPARPAGGAPQPTTQPRPDEGPVLVTIEYQIDPARADQFGEVMKETRRARLRQGVLSWGLFRDPAQPGRYMEYYLDANWVDHERRLERFTVSDVSLRERRLRCHLGAEPPRVTRYVGASPGD